jgi:hypothetical protein
MTASRDSKTENALRRAVGDVSVYLGLGLLFTHELDAMPNHEWRVLPLPGMLSEAAAQNVFVIAHVPIFAIVIALVASLDPRTRGLARIFASAFLLLHAGLHLACSGAPAYEFDSPLSSVLIYGAAVCGAVFFLAGGASEIAGRSAAGRQ